MMGGTPIDRASPAWILRHPARIVPIPGTGKVSHMQSAAEAVSLELNRDQRFRIWTASHGHDVP